MHTARPTVLHKDLGDLVIDQAVSVRTFDDALDSRADELSPAIRIPAPKQV